MNKSEFTRRGHNGPQNMDSTPVDGNVENSFSSISKSLVAVDMTETTAPEVSAPFAIRSG